MLSNCTTNLHELCSQTANDTTCSSLALYFENARMDLENKFSLFPTKRVKRGAIDVIGNVANSLFGVLDSNHEARMSATIHELRANDDHLENLLKNQTSLIDSTINVIKKEFLSTASKFEECLIFETSVIVLSCFHNKVPFKHFSTVTQIQAKRHCC